MEPEYTNKECPKCKLDYTILINRYVRFIHNNNPHKPSTIPVEVFVCSQCNYRWEEL